MNKGQSVIAGLLAAGRIITVRSTGAGDDDLAVANGSSDDVWVFLNEGDRIGVET